MIVLGNKIKNEHQRYSFSLELDHKNIFKNSIFITKSCLILLIFLFLLRLVKKKKMSSHRLTMYGARLDVQDPTEPDVDRKY